MKAHVLIVSLLLLPFGTSCGRSDAPADTEPADGVPAPSIDAAALRSHVDVLASDEYEGRAPASRGEELTVAYLTDQFQRLGLAPGNPDGTYVQTVPLVGITPDPGVELVFRREGTARTLRWRDDFVAWTKRVTEAVAITDSEMVFVGYGVDAPEYRWDDYKGVDLEGKTMVVLVNDPPVPAASNPDELDPGVFGGRAMTYYGRWTYKYEVGAAKGAAAVLIVHETEPAGYPFAVLQNSSGEQFDLVTPDENMGRVAIEGWLPREQAEALFAMGGHDFDALKARAASRDFSPVPLGVTASLSLRNSLRRIESANVIARLDGADPGRRDEYVIYTAHWDHLGVGDEVDGDRIYNGALDNATGTGGLIEMARAFVAAPRPPRSILFLAVTAEEQGLLGSRYYSVSPLYPLAKTLANINVDGLNVHGRTRDITIIGLGNSELDDYARDAAAAQQRVLRPDPEPEKGFYYRSDHFNFAKQGVPALYTDNGVDYVGRPEGFGQKVRERYTMERYHKPSDEIQPDWDLSGAIEDLQLLWIVGYRVAGADRYPEWRPGNEFKAIREASLGRTPSP